jgi:hypothetical protein
MSLKRNNCVQICKPCKSVCVDSCSTPCPSPCPPYNPCNPCPSPCPTPYPPYNPCPRPYPSCNPCPRPYPPYNPCNPCQTNYPQQHVQYYGTECACPKRSCEKKCKKEERKCDRCYRRKCECAEFYPCLRVKCGFVSATLSKTASPTTYTQAGETIKYSYTINNTGNVPICYPIQICDNKLGTWHIPCTYIHPCSSYTFTRSYRTTQQDVDAGSITNIASAYIQVKCKKWVFTNESSATITRQTPP